MRWLLLISAILVVSIPTINGETSIGGGPSVSVSEKSSAQGTFMTNGNEWKSSLVADAVKQVNSLLWVENQRGDDVMDWLQVGNGVGVSYNQYGSGPGQIASTDYVYREAYLDVDDADYIDAWVTASNNAGDRADSRITIWGDGHLTDYFNSGFAGPFTPWGATDGAFTAQSFGDAYGKDIHFYSYGIDFDGDYGGVDTEVHDGGGLSSVNNNRDGCLDGLCYGSQSAGHEHSDGHGEAGAMLYGGYGYTQNGEITQQMTARNGGGDEFGVGTEVYKGYFANKGYSLWAYSITDWDITRAVQYIDGSSYSGRGTYIEEFAWLNTIGFSDKYQEVFVSFWDQSDTSTGITHGYW